jgi:hypothetical protein
VVIGTRRLPRGGPNAVLIHELGDGALRDAVAAALQLGVDPRRAIAALAGLEGVPDLPDAVFTPGSALGPLRRRALPGVKPAAGDVEHPAHEPDGVKRRMGGDEGELRAHVFAAH